MYTFHQHHCSHTLTELLILRWQGTGMSRAAGEFGDGLCGCNSSVSTALLCSLESGS